jgi:hypothetical protein
VVHRRYFPLAFETHEHLSAEESARFESLLPELFDRFGARQILVSRSSKDPHRLGQARVLVRRFDGELVPMEEASHFIRHLARIDRYRIYASPPLLAEVTAVLKRLWS